MAKTKNLGGSRLGRDSLPKFLGIKVREGQKAMPGNIIIRQRGTKFFPGKNVKRASDDSLYAMKEGIVHFATKTKTGFNSAKKEVKVVNIEIK